MPFVMLISIGKCRVQSFIFIYCRSVVLNAFRKCKVRNRFCLRLPAPLLLQLNAAFTRMFFFLK